MDGVTMWVIGILSTIFTSSIAICFGFILKNRALLQTLEVKMNNKPDYPYVSNEFYKKEVAELQFKTIQDKFNSIQDDMKEVRNDFKMVGEKLDKLLEGSSHKRT